jgi:hypothetical protein
MFFTLKRGEVMKKFGIVIFYGLLCIGLLCICWFGGITVWAVSTQEEPQSSYSVESMSMEEVGCFIDELLKEPKLKLPFRLGDTIPCGGNGVDTIVSLEDVWWAVRDTERVQRSKLDWITIWKYNSDGYWEYWMLPVSSYPFRLGDTLE